MNRGTLFLHNKAVLELNLLLCTKVSLEIQYLQISNSHFYTQAGDSLYVFRNLS